MGAMLRPSDVVVLFALLNVDEGWTLRSVAERLGVKHSKVQRALERLAETGLYDPQRRVVPPQVAEEFVLHALRFLHPIREGPLVRGVPTAWGAAPLREEITSSDAPPVWPSATGTVRGPAIEPLDPVLPALVSSWPQVAELAALCDGLRIGDARSRDVAARHLRERLGATA
jgi:DNA-binding transcriptional MocR family regulator